MISVIIPCLNEEANLPGLLGSLMAEGADHEVIVVDGMSLDGTVAVARGAGAKVIVSEPGRGRQLFEGAVLAQGDVLLFLHADSIFPEGGLEAIDKALRDNPGAPGGNFRLLFDGDDGFSRWLEGFYAWLRSKGIYYGDSGIFVRSHVYERLGGIRPMALMEDYDFVCRLEGAGRTCLIETPALITSSRRFRGRCPVSIVWGWIKIHALYLMGADPDALARRYDSTRRREA
ncbi:MAG: TIGR04283 family arsenosugar biosynthesis glycosyltransferase [Proteobacteria bacterium]|nr:TIGR04283 family arsenosugar biosynthesis glycosyltransferase [Pseudomonadota bacterium]MDA1022465.1 TIGR04283 family arsenosugar biosynthesis glycosyltransferase [Pseudomonadota bacterium]